MLEGRRRQQMWPGTRLAVAQLWLPGAACAHRVRGEEGGRIGVRCWQGRQAVN